jgi:hypothetical protein
VKPSRPERARRRKKRDPTPPAIDVDGIRNHIISQAVGETLKAKAQAGMADFWYFIHHVFGPRHPGYRLLQDNLHKDMARFAQDFILEWEWVREQNARDPMFEAYIVKAMLEVFRGSGKSLTMIALATWVQLRNPDASLVIDSRTERLSKDFLEPIANRISGKDPTSDFIECYGNWFANDRVWTTTELTHAMRKNMGQIEASFETSANTKSQTSHHPDGVFTDDPVNEDDVTEGKLEQPIRHLRSWQNIIRVPGFHWYNGTPYSDADTIAYIKRNEGDEWRIMSREALMVDSDGREVSAAPTVRPLRWLKTRQVKDPVNFASQFMLRPGEGGHTPLTMQQFGGCLVNMTDVPMTSGYRTLHLDLAWLRNDDQAKGCYTVMWDVWHTANLSWVMRGFAKQRCKQEEHMAVLVSWLKQYGFGPAYPMLMTMDRDIGGQPGLLEKAFYDACARAGVTCPPVYLINRSTDKSKNARIAFAAGQVAAGNVRFVRGPLMERLGYELTHVGTSGYKDHGDAFADVFHPRVRQVAPFGWDDATREVGDTVGEPWQDAAHLVAEGDLSPFDMGIERSNAGALDVLGKGRTADIQDLLDSMDDSIGGW